MTHLDLDDAPRSDSDESSWRTWLIGALFTIVLGFGGTWGLSLQDRMSVSEHDSQVTRERLSSVEARVNAQQKEIDTNVADLKETSRRIEAKLDRILEQSQRSSPLLESQRFGK